MDVYANEYLIDGNQMGIVGKTNATTVCRGAPDRSAHSLPLSLIAVFSLTTSCSVRL